MSDRADWTIERRLLLGALICAVVLIGGYFVFVSLPWGHQFDDDAYFGRKALSRNVVKLDSDILGLVSTRALLIAATVLIVIATVRRCALAGVIAVAGFGCAVVGAEFLKDVLPWRRLVPDDALLSEGCGSTTHTRADMRPLHLARLELAFCFLVPLAAVVSSRGRLPQRNICDSRPVYWLASAV